MIFTIGSILFIIGYVWYRSTEYSRDWKDKAQFILISSGLTLVTLSLLILAWKYLP